MATPTSSNNVNIYPYQASDSAEVQTGRDANVQQHGQKPVAGNASTSPMSVNSQVGPIVVKQSGHSALEGSNAGVRAVNDVDQNDNASPAADKYGVDGARPFDTSKFKNQPGPRSQASPGQRNSQHSKE